ncbi:ankyrin repeat domain-containing protein [Parashewanella curva]|nr:ankyrin repeat domain-containing protein [Parashewanella curva]
MAVKSDRLDTPTPHQFQLIQNQLLEFDSDSDDSLPQPLLVQRHQRKPLGYHLQQNTSAGSDTKSPICVFLEQPSTNVSSTTSMSASGTLTSTSSCVSTSSSDNSDDEKTPSSQAASSSSASISEDEGKNSLVAPLRPKSAMGMREVSKEHQAEVEARRRSKPEQFASTEHPLALLFVKPESRQRPQSAALPPNPISQGYRGMTRSQSDQFTKRDSGFGSNSATSSTVSSRPSSGSYTTQRMKDVFQQEQQNIKVKSQLRSDTPQSENIHDTVKKGDFTKLKTLIRQGACVNLPLAPNWKTPLHCITEAVGQATQYSLHQQAMLMHLLKTERVNPNCQDKNGYTPLHYLCLNANAIPENILLELLRCGANPTIQNLQGLAPWQLCLVQSKASKQIIGYLVDNIASKDSVPTEEKVKLLAWLKVTKRNISIPDSLKALQSKVTPVIGANKHLKSVYQRALTEAKSFCSTKHKDHELDASLTKSQLKQYLEFINIREVQRVQDLLEQGYPVSLPSKNAQLAIHTACHPHKHSKALLEALLSHGADASAVDSEGISPLHVAAQNNNACVFELLKQHNGNLDRPDVFGRTPLHYAVTSCTSDDMVKLLVDNGAEVMCKDNNQLSPIHMALLNGNRSAAQIMVNSLTTKDFANHSQKVRLTAWLVEYNATEYLRGDLRDEVSYLFPAPE